MISDSPFRTRPPVPAHVGRAGSADHVLMPAAELVEFAVGWMERRSRT